MDSEKLLTARELAGLLSVDAGTIRRWARERMIPVVPLPGGSRVRFQYDKVFAAMQRAALGGKRGA